MRCDNTRLIENLISFSSMLMLSINVDLEFIFSLVTLFVVCLNWSPALICYIHLNWTYARNFHAKPFLFSIVFFSHKESIYQKSYQTLTIHHSVSEFECVKCEMIFFNLFMFDTTYFTAFFLSLFFQYLWNCFVSNENTWWQIYT